MVRGGKNFLESGKGILRGSTWAVGNGDPFKSDIGMVGIFTLNHLGHHMQENFLLFEVTCVIIVFLLI